MIASDCLRNALDLACCDQPRMSCRRLSFRTRRVSLESSGDSVKPTRLTLVADITEALHQAQHLSLLDCRSSPSPKAFSVTRKQSATPNPLALNDYTRQKRPIAAHAGLDFTIF